MRDLARLGALLWLGGCGFLPLARTSESGALKLAQVPKSQPVDSEFHRCGPAGDQPDYVLNTRKNRVDTGAWIDTPWSVIAQLPWPRAVGYRFRNQWSSGERDAVSQYEGAPVRTEGYLQGFKLEGREPTNCYSDSPAERDFHLWLTEHPRDRQNRSVVVEITPRIRAAHPGWTRAALDSLVGSKARLRVSGWLMLDQMHPELVGGNRATLWEVHPILQLEVERAGAWIPLDELVRAP